MCRLNVFLSIVLICTNSEIFAAHSKTIQLPFSAGEVLHYKLSYRGLLTSMIWADLADVTMSVSAIGKTPDVQNTHQFELYLTTENYTKAEMIKSVRYRYKTIVDDSINRTLLVEEIDKGDKNRHQFLWLDWNHKKTQLFKQREKKKEYSGLSGLDLKEVWEKDGSYSVSNFINLFPFIEHQSLDLIHKESGDNIEYTQILDPLSVIYHLRLLDFSMNSSFLIEMAVVVSDDIRLYKIQKLSTETLSFDGRNIQGTKFKIQSNEKKDHYYYLWLTNDNRKIPLRMSVDAPLGKIKIDLRKIMTH